MPSQNSENGDREQSAQEKFTKPREIAVLMSKVHPDRVRARTAEGDAVNASIEKDSPEYWGEQLVKILSGLQATGQMNYWQPDLRAEIVSRRAPEVRFVRKMEEEPELSDPVALPRAPRSFLLALDAYTRGADWDEVRTTMSAKTENADHGETEEIEQEVAEARTYEDLGQVARKVHATFKEGARKDSTMGFLSSAFKWLLSRRIDNSTNLSELAKEHGELTAFFKTGDGRLFRQSTVMDVLDNRALVLAKKQLTDAMSSDQVTRAVEAFHAYPFEFAFVYEQPFAETREDAIAKIDFLSSLRSKRSEQGLDDLRKEVEAHQFQSEEMASRYREQLIDFIERKREVYWPAVPRSNMPRG